MDTGERHLLSARCCKATKSLADRPLFDDFAKDLVRLDPVEANVKVHRRLNVTMAQKLPNRFVLAGLVLEEDRCSCILN
jgi:hypothetical protein